MAVTISDTAFMNKHLPGRNSMKQLWCLINQNEDGTPLLGIPGAGPVGILIGLAVLVRGLLF